jgi:hypothetical protein
MRATVGFTTQNLNEQHEKYNQQHKSFTIRTLSQEWKTQQKRNLHKTANKSDLTPKEGFFQLLVAHLHVACFTKKTNKQMPLVINTWPQELVPFKNRKQTKLHALTQRQEAKYLWHG